MIFRRGSRFDELAGRQLAIFANEESELLREAEAAERAWQRAGRDLAEEAYGDYQLVVDAIADRLLDIREAYASTLEESTGTEYRRSFNRVAARRFPRYVSLLADLDDA